MKNSFRQALQVFGILFLFCVGVFFYVVVVQGIVMEDLVRAYQEVSLKSQERKLKNLPDCEGEAIIDLGKVKLKVPRTKKIHVRFDYKTYEKPIDDVLVRPNLYFGCEKKEFAHINNLYLDSENSKIGEIILEPEKESIQPNIFGNEKRSMYLTDKWKQNYEQSDDESYLKDANGEKVKPEKYFDQKEYDNGVARVETHSNIYFILPYDRFPTANEQRVAFRCMKGWDAYKKEFMSPRKCGTNYSYPSGMRVHYSTLYEDGFENAVLTIEEEFRAKLDSLIIHP